MRKATCGNSEFLSELRGLYIRNRPFTMATISDGFVV